MRSSPFWVTMRPVMPKSGTLPPLRQAERSLQRGLAASLPLEVFGRVVGGDLPVGRRIPGVLSMPLSTPTSRSPSQMNTSCSPNPPPGVRSSSRLGRAHRRDEIGEGQAALQKVHLSVPLELVPVVELPGQADLAA